MYANVILKPSTSKIKVTCRGKASENLNDEMISFSKVIIPSSFVFTFVIFVIGFLLFDVFMYLPSERNVMCFYEFRIVAVLIFSETLVHRLINLMVDDFAFDFFG